MLFIEMVESSRNPCKIKIANVPYDLDSNLHSCVQIADWICTLLGKTFAYEVRPREWGPQKEYYEYFNEEIKKITGQASVFQKSQGTLVF